MAIAEPSTNALVFMVVTALCIIIPLDLTQLVFAILGALAYYVITVLQRSPERKDRGQLKQSAQKNLDVDDDSRDLDFKPFGSFEKPFGRRNRTSHDERKRFERALKPVTPSRTPHLKQASHAPVRAPSFEGTGFEVQVQELVSMIMPTSESDRIVDRLAEAIKLFLSNTLPEAEVLGFTSGDLSRRKAFGVAVPDVDIVINISPDDMAKRLNARPQKTQLLASKPDARKLQKSAIRMCTDKLVSAGGFKFRRSAFSGNEPKVTLLAPAELGIFSDAVPIDLHVNTVVPLHSAALLTECGHIDARAKELILLVRRWTKDRGICHHPKGHFSPYIWSLLTIYFLQVGPREEGALLPPLEKFEAASKLMKPGARSVSPKTEKWHPKTVESVQKQTAARLLQAFMKFYADFDWKLEAVCVRSGERAASASLPIHIMADEINNSTEVGPSVEDPFEPKDNLGACMTSWSFQRMKEELCRANLLLSSESPSLSTLLEPWAPEASGDPEM